MEQKITQELIEQAKKAESAEALLALAKENGVALTGEDAQRYYDMWHTTAELSDKELDNVAGGCTSGTTVAMEIEDMLREYRCVGCNKVYRVPSGKKGIWNYRCECGALMSHTL